MRTDTVAAPLPDAHPPRHRGRPQEPSAADGEAAAAPVPPADQHDGIEAFPVAFTGSGGEFFRVWIVNLLLNIVTLGFYTPFARRRTAQYFYGHTLVAGSPLEFTAPQRKMVFGFLLLVALYGAFNLAAETGQDTAVAIFMLAGAALAPYLWASAMRFRLSSTRWRGVRLQFVAGWGEVYQASWPVFAAAGIGVAMGFAIRLLLGQPLAIAGVVLVGLISGVLCIIRLEYNYKQLLVARAQIGAQAGRWKPVYSDFVRIWLATLAVLVAGAVVVSLVAGVLAGGSIATFAKLKDQGTAAKVAFVIVATVAFLFGLILASAPARAYREARMFKLVWSNVGVSRIARFRSKLKVRRFVWLRIRNMLLTLLTLGFFRPFALVSEYRMKTESVTLHVKGGVDQLVGQLVQQQGGLGDAVADAVGLDLVG